MWCWRTIEKIKWSAKITNEFVECIGEKRTLQNIILHKKTNWIGHILRRNCLSSWCHWMTDDRSERSRKKKTDFLDDLRNRRKYWELMICICNFGITCLFCGKRALGELWLPSNEGFFIWFNFSYTCFLLEAEWWAISPLLHERTW